jgi:hypothetical protein
MLFRIVKILVPVAILVLFAVKIAAAADVSKELMECRALASAVARLDCYDQFVDARMASSIQTEGARAPKIPAPADAAAVTANPAANVSQEEIFGKNEAEIRKSVQEAAGEKEIDQIEARVSKVRESSAGKAIITLDNGQVWTQIDSSRLRLSGDDRITIRRASLGSFMLSKTGSKVLMRVKRIS